MQFRVPQFIDIEDKILGPLTWKQFAYSLGAAGITYISFRFTGSKFVGLLIAAPFVALFMSLAFVKINNQSFVDILEHAFDFFSKSRLYTWQRSEKVDVKAEVVVTKKENDLMKNYTKKSLTDIAKDLDVMSNDVK